MAVQVRMFAALREAAGTGEATVEAGPLPRILSDLSQRYGEQFRARLRVASVLVDGSVIPRDAVVDVPDGAEVALLPPVSGGAHRHRRWHPPVSAPAGYGSAPMAKTVVSAGIGLAALVGVVSGGGFFAAVVLVVTVLLVLDLQGMLASAGMRPVLPVAAGAAVAAPLVVLADPADGWERLPAVYAIGALLAFVLVLVFGRRHGVVSGLAGTLLVALVGGLGAAGLLLLREVPQGFRWLVGLGLLSVAADLAAPIARTLRARLRPQAEPAAPSSVVAALVAVTVVGAILVILLAPPFTPGRVAGLALVAVAAAIGGDHLQRSLAVAGRLDPDPAGLIPGTGAVLAVADAAFLSAPVAYAYARALVEAGA